MKKKTGIFYCALIITGMILLFVCSGFTALPGGHRPYNNGPFSELGYDANFWTSSVADSTYNTAWNRILIYEVDSIDSFESFKGMGFSVHCFKDK